LGDLFNIEKISEYEILMIYVCKDFRKKGLGTKLLNIIEENNTRLKKIYLEVSKNNSEGISFYTKMKFKEMHTRKNYFFINNKYIDALAMVKSY
jgi:ribosomal protein S18 acetylase RimI-like enzyme